MDRLAADPIIVYGAPRSGTTYLTTLLNSHPEVCISQEIRLFVWLHQALYVLPHDGRFLLNKREVFVDHLRQAFPGLVREFYKKMEPDARYWGDKNPHYASQWNSGCLETIVELFPGSRFIHIIRDGRDVALSLMRRGWADFEDTHHVWAGHVKIGSAFGRSLPPNQYFELRYEDLIRDDEGMAHALFAFLGIPFHTNVGHYCRDQHAARTPWSHPTREIRGGAASSDWQRLLSPAQRLSSLDLAGELLLQYGYETPASLARLLSELTVETRSSYRGTLDAAVRKAIPSKSTVLVVSGGDEKLLLSLAQREVWHFPSTEGNVYAGHLAISNEAAIGHLEELRAKGADYLLFPSTAFRWLEHYIGFRQHLDAHYQRVWDDDSCVIYWLAPLPTRSSPSVATPDLEPAVILYIVGGCPEDLRLHRSLRDFPVVNRQKGESKRSHLARVTSLITSAIEEGGTHLLVPREEADWLGEHPLLVEYFAHHHRMVEANSETGIVFELHEDQSDADMMLRMSRLSTTAGPC